MTLINCFQLLMPQRSQITSKRALCSQWMQYRENSDKNNYFFSENVCNVYPVLWNDKTN